MKSGKGFFTQQKQQPKAQAQPQFVQRKTIKLSDDLKDEYLLEESSIHGEVLGGKRLACGHGYVNIKYLKEKGLPVSTWTGDLACNDENCSRPCDGEGCPKILCIIGKANGFKVRDGEKTLCYCPDCYEAWKKSNWWKAFWRGFLGGSDD